MFSNKVESSIKHICNITNRALDDTENFNITEFGETMMKLNLQDQKIEDTINISQSSTNTYKQVVMGPQETVVAVSKFIPSLTEPMKKSLEQMIKGSYKEYETLETGRILAAAIIDIFITAHDAFKFLESYNAR